MGDCRNTLPTENFPPSENPQHGTSIAAFDAAPTVFYRILLMTLYATGLRRAELAHLKVSDIDR